MRPFGFPHLTVAPFRRAGVLAALVLSIAVAQAVSISPVVVELSPSRRIASVTFSNPGSEPIRYQSRVLAWSQVDGVDRYEASDALIVAPPIAEIPAGGKQIFRVALRGAAASHERAFRMVFEDVTATLAAPTGEVAIKLRVTHDLPVFVAVDGNPSTQLRLQACPKPSAPGCVRLENTGSHYAQIRSLSIERGAWSQQKTVNTRVLAGAWKQWQLDLPVDGAGSVKVSAHALGGVVSTELPAAGL